MRQYAMRRLLFLVPVLFTVSVITFFGLNLVPGDPALVFLGVAAEKEQITSFRERHRLNDPIVERYGRWLWGVFRGDPGEALNGANINRELKSRFPVTLHILVFSFAFTMLFGLMFGVLAAVFQDTPLDYGVRTFSIFGQSIPDFYALTLLLIIPAILWRYAPPAGFHPIWEDPVHLLEKLVPPTLLLAVGNSAFLMRLMRSALLEVLRQDYIRTARAKGLQDRLVLTRHALKNAMIPALTVAGALIAGLLGGSVILEQIASMEGLGRFTFNAVLNKDYNIVMTMVMYAAMVVVLANLAVDLMYAFVDPRIRYR